MSYDDYPYETTDQKCKHDASKTVGKVSTWGQIRTTISDAKVKLAE